MFVDFAQPFILRVDDVLTQEECEAMIERIDTSNPSHAPISTARGPVSIPSYRNNERVMFDDQEYADFLYKRLQPHVPEEFLESRLVGTNERLRCYRYSKGHRFLPHGDGFFARNANERSFYTCLIYLNEGFEGGETKFTEYTKETVIPKRGMALLFQHPLVHEGCEVRSGRKYVLRTDLMYRRSAA